MDKTFVEAKADNLYTVLDFVQENILTMIKLFSM